MKNKIAVPNISAVDLFCGVGGLTHGLIQGGIKVTTGIDVDKNCRYPYEQNNRATFIEKDIRVISGFELKKYFLKNTLHLLAGCAPCQPFSTYSRSSKKKETDEKWNLLLSFSRIIDEVKPDLVTMENVPQLIEHQIFEQFIKGLKEYWVCYQLVNCADFGVPQTRTRLVLLASRLGPIDLILPTHKGKHKSVESVLKGIRPISAGQSDPNDSLHKACSLSPLNLKRIQASKPGGTWRDWPTKLRSPCHKKVSGETYPSVYGRMEWESPAPTITTQCFGYGNGRFGHPEQDRAISLREAAVIQTFPPNYVFVEKGKPVKFNILGKLIGNAVPVRLGKIIAQSIVQHTLKYQVS